MKIRQYYEQNRIFICGMILLFVFSMIYLVNATSNIPVMDYWTYINEFTDKVFMGNVTISDLWSNFTSHRAPFQYICFFINLYFFSGNTLVSIYAGNIVTVLSVFYLYNCCKKQLDEKGQISIRLQLGMLFMAMLMFSLKRWEIITLEFSMAFAVRIFLYIVIFDLIDKLCRGNDKCSKYVWEIGGLIFITIIGFSSSYFPAMVAAIAIIMLVVLVKEKTRRKKFFSECIIIGGFTLGATLIYLNGLNTGTENVNIVSIGFWVNLLKAVLIMLASSLFHESILTHTNMYWIGSIILAIYLIVIFFYIKEKLYEVTYMPLMFIIYAVVSMVMISYARVELYGVSYVMASRYTYESILGLVGIVWISILLFVKENGEKAWLAKKKIIIAIVSGFLLISLLWTYKIESDMAVYRKQYMMNLQTIALNIDEYSDEELSGFQANQPEFVRNGIELLKKYKLSIFKYN